MATDTSAETTASGDDEHAASADAGTTLGLERNVLAALGYVFGLIGGIVLLVLEDDGYVRHHAAQSVVFSGAVIVAWFLVGVLELVLGFVPFVGGLLGSLLGLLFWVGALGGFLLLAYKAYSGERYELPVLGGYAGTVEGLF